MVWYGRHTQIKTIDIEEVVSHCGLNWRRNSSKLVNICPSRTGYQFLMIGECLGTVRNFQKNQPVLQRMYLCSISVDFIQTDYWSVN